MRRVRWFILSAFVGLFNAMPAEAGTLQSWQFDRSQNRLEFITDEAVQPRAQLLPNPTRIVIDLPNTTLERSLITEPIGGQIRNLRIGQFDRTTTRLVVELAPGFTLDPQQVKVSPISLNHWVVELAEVQPLPTAPTTGPTTGPTTSPTTAPTPTVTAATRITGLRETPDGIFIRTSGALPEVDLFQSLDRTAIELDIPNAAIDPELATQTFTAPNLGLAQIVFSQVQANPPLARIRLELEPDAPGWQASVSNLGGIVLLPQRQPVAIQPRPTAQPQPTLAPTPQTPAQVQAVTLDVQGNQLLIQTDRPLNFQGQYRGQEYQVILTPAQLAPNVQGPDLPANSPLSRVRLRQEDPQTVVILLEPAPSVGVDFPQAVNERLISLQLQGSSPIAVPPPSANVTPPPTFDPGPVQLPTVPQGQIVVVIDPGHGGPDPGAIGIGGIQEKNIVLPISLDVAAVLAQQGIQVVLTRQDDRDVGLEPRVQLAEQVDATIFVSIHANAISLSRPDVNGVETYYYSSRAGLALAQSIHQSLLQNLPTRDRQVREARFYVLRRTSMPSALVEVGFVTGVEDAPRLADANYRRQVALAIAQGILRYLQ